MAAAAAPVDVPAVAAGLFALNASIDAGHNWYPVKVASGEWGAWAKHINLDTNPNSVDLANLFVTSRLSNFGKYTKGTASHITNNQCNQIVPIRVPPD